EAIPVEQPPVPKLSYGLDRVLFNPGVYNLRDARSRVYNFDPYLEDVMPVHEFNFSSLGLFMPPSKDPSLAQIARDKGKRYIGSTSSMSGVLMHFHFLLSQWRDLNFEMLSKAFGPVQSVQFTSTFKAPAAIILRWRNGTYAIDADKQFDSGNILSMLGKSLEKLLTLPKEDYERYRKSHSDQITQEERAKPESYHYSGMGGVLVRSQLDAYDPRLPGTGMFDLKTRAVVTIRMDSADYEKGLGYQIKGQRGLWESYEREYHDMIRTTMFKYSLQVRMGRMDGIFVAYHNVEQIFGFQYVGLEEMDLALHGQSNTTLGDGEFRLSLDLFNKILDKATKKFPEQSIRLHFETRTSKKVPFMYIFAEPVTEEEAESIQKTQKERVDAYERKILGLHEDGTPVTSSEKLKEEWRAIQAQVDTEMEEEEDQESLSKDQGSEEADPKLQPDLEISNSGSETQNEQHSPFSEAVDPQEAAPSQPSPSQTTSGKPLLALTLTIRNKVDDQYVARPTNLSPDQKWELEYLLTEISNERVAWGKYHQVQDRRRNALDPDRNSSEDEGKLDFFRRQLRDLADQGRVWKRARDEVDERVGEAVVWVPDVQTTKVGEGSAGEGEGGGGGTTGEVEDVESYLRWLYGEGKPRG
ncbi:Pet127-domain-containing protein, partial [Patellaria atrata CBS 101060]